MPVSIKNDDLSFVANRIRHAQTVGDRRVQTRKSYRGIINGSAASDITGVSWERSGGIMKRAVKQGLARRGDAIPHIIQVFSRHRYFTIITDPLNHEESELAAYFKKWFWRAAHFRLEPIRKAAKTLKRHWAGIQAAIMNGISNSATEGLNSKIEVIKRSACGYRNKDNFRTAILFHCGKLNLMPEMGR